LIGVAGGFDRPLISHPSISPESPAFPLASISILYTTTNTPNS